MSLPTIPVNSLSRHIAPLKDALTRAAAEIIASGHYVMGPSVAAFERAFADYCGVEHCVGVANGTDALELALKAVGVGPGTRVGVIANAAMYSTSAVLACGGVPHWIDVDESATLDVDSLERALASGVELKCVVVTHLYGRLAAMEKVVPLCRDHGIALVEDCAQAHGATLPDGRRAGSFGDAATFSFYPTKNLGALGDGGAVTARRSDIADQVRALRQYGWSAKYRNELRGGRNSRLDEIQARFLLTMLPELDGWNARRRDIANRYSREIRNPAILTPPEAGTEYVGHLYVVRTDRRADLQAHLAAAGVQSDVHYPTPDHLQPCFGGEFQALELPRTLQQATRVLTLPCFPEMEHAEIERVIDACNRFE